MKYLIYLRLVAYGCLGFGISLQAVEVTVESSALPFSSNLDRDAINRMEETALISGDGSRIVYVDRCLHGTSLSALGYSVVPENMGAIKVYDVGSGQLRTLYEGQFGNRTNGGVAYLESFIAADLTGDGRTVVAAILAITVTESGGEWDSLTRVIKVVTINVGNGAVSEITQFAASGHSDTIALRCSADGRHALIAAHMPTGETTSTWGLTYPLFGNTYELIAVPLTPGAQATLLTDPDDDTGLGTYGGVRYSFDIDGEGQNIIYSQNDKETDKMHIVTSGFGGSNRAVVASDLTVADHVAISGDGRMVTYCDWKTSSYEDDEIYINSVSGGQEQVILSGSSSQFGMFAMDETGKAVVFTSGLGGDGWYYRSFHLYLGGSDITRTDVSKGSLSASTDLSVVLCQNDDSPLYLSKVTVPGGGGGGNTTGVDFLDAAADVGDNWFQSDWFGYFQKGDFPWVYHYEHGWIYFGDGSEDGVIYFDKCLLWVYTSRSMYPWMYSYYDGDWNRFYMGTVTPNRWWYSTLYDTDYLEFTWDD